ncbi:E3 ubiquitin-protein ligase TRIM39 [Conger conger]|uniref:E3 ubiquitin-protein ligase TRIM39 n=1 Tax=Conger conger TaxID=82655 RepID=UPI002A5A204E|nr:E3 ubiquitin-protein ligase TRIM39 [Conger conger]XP_061108804.1 E3 ubiquitin-protein ligase TRIM39 [Conger conger]XP_061108806.1 E3 ubiquitin-protein ligase TRIM39 [Conger conger]XP_061108807.1 E3 ubiquitin-protein ligase TRIM39 [Conger conger]
MASVSRKLSEEQCYCSICLDVFSSPVSIPCGHSFCMGCIGGYWMGSSHCQCPMCKKTFYKRPDISVNTVLRDIAEQLRGSRASPLEGNSPPEEQLERSPETQMQGPRVEGVACDVCSGEQQLALKSCLVCLTSYCEEHLRSHNARFTKHKLIQPISSLQDRMCQKHERLLELFCRSDQTCVCVLCVETEHRAHFTVSAERAWAEKKAQLKKTEAEVQQMMQDRWKKVEEIRQCVELSRSSTQREIEDSAQVFSTLMRSIETRQAELTEVMEEKQRAVEKHAEDLIKDLEQELTELQKRNSQLENLSQTEDHLYFLQSFQSQCTLPNTQDWSGAGIHTDVCVGAVRRCVEQLEVSLTEQEDKLAEMELRRIQKYAVGVTLDSATANPWLQLSESGKQLRHGGVWQGLVDGPERFDTVVIALGREGFARGRHYWEVQVGLKDDWYLGVAKASVKRKGRIAVSTGQGYWALAMKGGREYRASCTPPAPLSLPHRPRQVGIYLDYEEGQVSFYDVEARSHLYTFMDSFSETLRPFFYLYCCDKSSDCLTITPVNPTPAVKQC